MGEGTEGKGGKEKGEGNGGDSRGLVYIPMFQILKNTVLFTYSSLQCKLHAIDKKILT